MIVKKIDNPDKASTKAARVILLTDYIRRPELSNATEKCIYAGARGFISDDPKAQQREMIALSRSAVKSHDPIVHWILSWAEGEQPNPAQIEELITIFLEAMGLDDHQIVYGLHADTENWHVHLAINRVHPVTERTIKPNKGFDKESAHRALADIEHRQGWSREAGGRYRVLENGEIARAGTESRTEPRQQARDFERRYGEKSAERIGIEVLPDILGRVTNWAELHRQMAVAGLRYEQKGSGAIIWVGDQPIKASSADRGASIKKLVTRFGPFEPAVNPPPLQPRAPEPIKAPPPRDWTEYAQARADHIRAKKQAEAELWRGMDVEKRDLLATNKEDRDRKIGSNSWKGRGGELNVLRSKIAAQQAVGRVELDERHHRQRAELIRKFRSFPDFETWLKAAKRDEDAAELWRHERNEPGVMSGQGENLATPRDIRAFASTALGNAVYYSRKGGDGAAAFVDTGAEVTIFDWRDPDSLLAALQLSSAKWPSGFVITGDAEFRQKCVELAVAHRIRIVNPELRDAISKERQRVLDAHRRARSAPEQLEFERYSAAVGADRYRLTAERKRDPGPNTIFVIDGKGEGARGLPPELVQQHMAALIAHQDRGDGVFYTPISEKRHHISISGMKAEDLKRLRSDGYRPAIVTITAAGVLSAVVNVAKLDSPFDAEIGDKLAVDLNAKYGAGTARTAIERNFAPGFRNGAQHPPGLAESAAPVRIEATSPGDCLRALRLSREIEADLRRLVHRFRESTHIIQARQVSISTCERPVVD